MKPTSTLLLLTSLLSTASAQGCTGAVYNTYCCVNGRFSGPVISSVRSSVDDIVSSARDEASSIVATATEISGRDVALITAAPVMKRAITTEVMEGLTCVGDELREFGQGGGSSTITGGEGTTVEFGGSGNCMFSPFV